jgi:sulfur transfer protein SufE
MKSTDSQTALIKGWLLNGRSITQLDALNMFGCFRLAARIADIREQGVNIMTEMITVNDKRIASYYLEK